MTQRNVEDIIISYIQRLVYSTMTLNQATKVIFVLSYNEN